MIELEAFKKVVILQIFSQYTFTFICSKAPWETCFNTISNACYKITKLFLLYNFNTPKYLFHYKFIFYKNIIKIISAQFLILNPHH